jgi:hypothetical protein
MTVKTIMASVCLALGALTQSAWAENNDRAPAVGGTPPVEVGDGAIHGDFLKPYMNTFVYTVKFDDGRKITQGLWSDLLQPTTFNGKPALRRVQGMTFVDGRMTSTVNIFDPDTLSPLFEEQRTAEGRDDKRTFAAGHMTSVHRSDSKAQLETVEVNLEHPVYDFYGGMYALLLSGLPLRAGYHGQIRSINERTDDISMVPFEVLRQDWVQAGPLGKVRAWVVSTDIPGQYRMTAWVVKSAPYVLKLEATIPDRHAIASWDMI